MSRDIRGDRIDAMLELVLLELKILKRKADDVMGAIADFAAKMQAHNAAVDTAVAGITSDIQVLNDKITALQSSQGVISPEDQALLDDLEQRGALLADKVAALDALTPPPQPVVPPSA